METWRAIMTSGAYPYASIGDEHGTRFGVLDDESDKLKQPLIGRRGSFYSYDSDGNPLGDGDDDEDEDQRMERGTRLLHASESDQLLRARKYDEISLKPPAPSPTEMLRSLVTKVIWPMTAVGAQTAKVYAPLRAMGSRNGVAVDDPHTLRSVTTLGELTKSRRRSADVVEELHDKALQRIALGTLFLSAWLIITVYRNSD